MRPIDQVLKARREARRSITVPEWGGLRLFFGPLTTNDIQAVHDRMQDDGKDPDKNTLEKRITLLIQKAELEDGSRAFEFGDRVALMESAEWAVLSRVVGFMYQSSMTGLGEEEAKKKSETTETSDSD